MIKKVLFLFSVLALAACTETHDLTTCRGSFAAANPGQWQPTSEDLRR